MNRIALAFMTKDRTELSRQTVQPLLQPDKLDLFWMDGSQTEEGYTLPHKVSLDQPANHNINVHADVRGGPDAAIVYALTTMLKGDYTHIGLVENDVLLDPDWFEPTMVLFTQGKGDGLEVGAVSARCYADRMLCQRDGYALMHNLGAGMVVFTRDAARLVLENYRTGWTMANRAVFAQLAGVDIGRYWAFKGAEHWLTADWGFDRTLAVHGYASLALTPSKCKMIGQSPSLAEQGLILVDKETEFKNDAAFSQFVLYTGSIRNLYWALPDERRHRDGQGELIFAHQFPGMGHIECHSPWTLKWAQGFGPFAWQAKEAGASFKLPLFGPVHILLNGGEQGGSFEIVDEFSNFEAKPTFAQGILAAAYVPAGMTRRVVRVTATSPGVLVHGVQTIYPQPWVTDYRFAHHILPAA